MSEKFNKAVEKVLFHEGGYVNDPDDPGGETKFGISKRSFPNMDIENMSRDQAIDIYNRFWWRKYGYENIESADIAAKIFDLAVNMGPGTAHTHLQLAVMSTGGKNLKIDGVMGPRTIEAVNSHPLLELLLATLKLRAVKYYADLGKDRFLRGWIYRALD